MERSIIRTKDAPPPLGPYSQAVVADGLIFTSGQIGIDPETGELARGVAEQTRRAMENLSAVLKVAGSGLEKAVKTTVYLADLSDFGTFNEIYATYFDSGPPARSTLEVSTLPKGAAVEIEMVALP